MTKARLAKIIYAEQSTGLTGAQCDKIYTKLVNSVSFLTETKVIAFITDPLNPEPNGVVK